MQNFRFKTIYSNIESHLFDTVETRFEDKTLPNTDLQDGQVQPFIEQITEIFGSVNFKNFEYSILMIFQM